MSILDEINNLVLTTEEEYYSDSSFWNRHKGKILTGAGVLGAGALTHSGALGVGAQHFLNSNLRMTGQGAQILGNKLVKIGSTYPIPGKTIPFTGVSV